MFSDKFSISDIESVRSVIGDDKLEYKLNLMEIFLYPKRYPELNSLISNKLQLNSRELKELVNYMWILNQRLLSIFNHAQKKKCLIMVDAEQTYLQKFIDYSVAYYFKLFNKDDCLIANTFQAYLKEEPYKLAKLTNFCKNHNLKLGVKLVRGAYMNEENSISKKNNQDTPICNSLEDTNNNYNQSIINLFQNYRDGDRVN